MKYVIRTLIVLLILVIGIILFLYSGAYNVSAMVPHNRLTLWMINTLKDNSIEKRSSDIKVPNNLNDTSLVKIGFEHYREMCQGCHGAPGIERNEIGQGLYPKPPNLAHSAKEMPASELFWITKNGIKLTGMPAFGKTHSDDKIWAIVAFMKTLPSMSKEQYQTLNDLYKN
jgi:mono/diheme cytochrome c family protein